MKTNGERPTQEKTAWPREVFVKAAHAASTAIPPLKAELIMFYTGEICIGLQLAPDRSSMK